MVPRPRPRPPVRVPRRRALPATVLAVGLLLTAAPGAEAAYSISRWTVDGGGTSGVQGGIYVVAGTLGQPDAGVVSGGVYILVGGFWGGTSGTVVGVEDTDDPGTFATPLVTRSFAPRPNPVLASARIAFDLAQAREVDVGVYDVGGRRVRSLLTDRVAQGHHALDWDVRDESGGRVASGVYFVRVHLGDTATSHRLVVIR